jgi:hypothetical protein
VLAIATKAQARLHARYWRLVERRKPTTVAATAVARELTGFCWALMRLPPDLGDGTVLDGLAICGGRPRSTRDLV